MTMMECQGHEVGTFDARCRFRSKSEQVIPLEKRRKDQFAQDSAGGAVKDDGVIGLGLNYGTR